MSGQNDDACGECAGGEYHDVCCGCDKKGSPPMRTMVDAEKLTKFCLDRQRGDSMLSAEAYDVYERIIIEIDDLSVEVPDTPDVLGEFREWCEKKRDESGWSPIRTRVFNLVIHKLDELQAKKEAGDG